MSMYDNISCYVHTDAGPTNTIHLSKGTKQGDPASPFIFTLCMLAITHRLNRLQPSSQQSYHNHLLLADDLTIISHDPEFFRRLHRTVVDFMDEHQLNVNASKTCFSATIAHSNQQRRTDPRIELRYHNERIPRIDLKTLGSILATVLVNRGMQFGLTFIGYMITSRNSLQLLAALVCAFFKSIMQSRHSFFHNLNITSD